jgi:hypothetical protein
LNEEVLEMSIANTENVGDETDGGVVADEFVLNV